MDPYLLGAVEAVALARSQVDRALALCNLSKPDTRLLRLLLAASWALRAAETTVTDAQQEWKTMRAEQSLGIK